MATDKPAVNFNFDTYKADAGEDYAFILDGKRHTIPSAASLKGVQFFEAALGGDARATMHVLREVMTDAQLEKLRESANNSIPALGAFVRDYLKQGGVGAGNE